MAKVIKAPTEVQAVRPHKVKVGDVLILGAGETRVEVHGVALGEFVASTKISYSVFGLEPEQLVHQTFINDKTILSREVR